MFADSIDVDYTLLDCGANYGYWSVLVSSKPFGSHKAIAIEPSGQNYPKLANNARVNGNRFETDEMRDRREPAAPRVCPAPSTRPSASPAIRLTAARTCRSSRSTI